ncbi:P1 family peptidase [Nocardia puris]|uniref:L-aminopeptidase/D-esterase-like protein n=1 Tax=Nocardia puris TaxID=208602 RepID=A0A366CX04_9NOCA|nr:P1 family peptidase [Nocardia puris]MBF6215563.1 P1 family peptidase [Nocardia puris]MBF6370028.1 P1 family peptidase [Nocardia puris]MBF6463506.1 P1 family peptidase [Nocardia puris]RBO82145.1 L-aminopeptidase/D-esterase-like protein [Nocardia puris]
MKAVPGPRDALTDVAGLLVGHHHALDEYATLGSGAATGCTVVRAPGGVTAAVDVRGGGPGTRETDLLDPGNAVRQLNAILLTGGSAYGLAAADGVMRWLEEHGEGIPMDPADPSRVVPIVPGAVIFDLPVGDWHIRPTADFGFLAAEAAAEEFARGSVGAGVGARAGSVKGGVGTASVVLGPGPAEGVTVAALVVANPVGSVFDPRTGLPWAIGTDGPERVGLRTPTAEELARANALPVKGTVLNTTIGVVATDAPLDPMGCRRMAITAHDGLGRAIRPAHSPLDGDTLFALATGRASIPDFPLPPAFPKDLLALDTICTAAALCVERAVLDAVLTATPVADIPSYSSLFPR